MHAGSAEPRVGFDPMSPGDHPGQNANDGHEGGLLATPGASHCATRDPAPDGLPPAQPVPTGVLSPYFSVFSTGKAN